MYKTVEVSATATTQCYQRINVPVTWTDDEIVEWAKDAGVMNFEAEDGYKSGDFVVSPDVLVIEHDPNESKADSA